MRVVETPLPANVVVSKLLASEGFGRAEAGVGENKHLHSNGASTSVSIMGSILPTDCSSSARVTDKKNPVPISDHSSVSENKKIDTELSIQERLLPSLECVNSSKPCGFVEANNFFSSMPKCAAKQLQQRAGKLLRSGSPRSKRPRMDQVSMNLSGAGDHNAISGNKAKCTLVERTSILKQKSGQDNKRGDRRNFKVATKTKYDSFLSKVGLMGSSATGVNSIFGLYGLKSDIYDVTKQADEPSLNELLDGSYKFPTLCPQKENKATNNNENIVCTVKEAFSILSCSNAVDSQNSVELDGSGNRRLHTCIPNSTSPVTCRTEEDTRKAVLMEGLQSLAKDCCGQPGIYANLSDSSLYQPKDMLQRLALPPFKDLDALLQDTPGPSVSLPTMDPNFGKQISKQVSLQPFPWSMPVGGACKLNFDSGKLFNNRTPHQSRWARIGCNDRLFGNITSSCSEWASIRRDNSVVPSGELENDGLHDNDKVLPAAAGIPCHGWWAGLSFPAVSPLASHVSDKTMLKDSVMINSYNAELNLPGNCMDSSDTHLKFSPKELKFCGKLETEESPEYQGNEAALVKPNNLSNTENEHFDPEMEQHSKSQRQSTGASGYSPSKRNPNGYQQLLWHLPLPENPEAVNSPRVMDAAKILCELASASNVLWKQDRDSGKVRCHPKKASLKTMNRLKKTGGLFIAPKSLTKPGHLAKSMCNVSPGQIFSSTDTKRNRPDIKHIHPTPMNWSLPSVSGLPSISKKNLLATTKQLNADSTRLLGPMVSSTWADKACTNQQMWKAATTALNGKDWGRGRSKKG